MGMDLFTHEIYWDDSGTDKASPIAVAACYVARKSQWDQFVRNWDEARASEGFDVFHMADFMAKPEYGVKPFSEWDRAKKNRVYFRLANIINTRVSRGFGIAVPKDAFDKYALPRFRQEYADNHYTFAVKTCMGLVDEWHGTYAKGEGMQYFFDYTTTGRREISDLWKMMDQEPEMAAKGGFRPAGWSFEKKDVFKPLQAADILAWNQFTNMRDYVLKGSTHVSPYFMALRRDRPMTLGFFSDAQVKKMFDDAVKHEQEQGKPPWAVPNWKGFVPYGKKRV